MFCVFHASPELAVAGHHRKMATQTCRLNRTKKGKKSKKIKVGNKSVLKNKETVKLTENRRHPPPISPEIEETRRKMIEREEKQIGLSLGRKVKRRSLRGK